jgi:hypothetical protein
MQRDKYVLVPKKPTKEILAVMKRCESGEFTRSEAWRLMLDAATQKVNPASLSSSDDAQPASMGLHAAPVDAQEGGEVLIRANSPQIEVGDIVQFFAASHPLNEPQEYIGRVERDCKGLHAANRYLPLSGVRIIEKGKSHESND